MQFNEQQKVAKQLANRWTNVSTYGNTIYLKVEAVYIWDVYFTDQTCTICRPHEKR